MQRVYAKSLGGGSNTSILMRRGGHTQLTLEGIRPRLIFTIVFILIFFCAGVFLPELTNPASAEGTALTTIDPSSYSVSINSIGTVSVNLETVPYTNVIRAGKDTLTTTITTPASSSNNCKLYLSTDSTTNNSLVLSGTAEGSITDTNSIPASTGTLASPIPLTDNSWGYALSNTTPGLPTSGFDADYETDLPAVSATSKWAGVPTKSHEQLFQTIPMNQSSTTTNIYYGVSAKDNLQEGSYTNTIIYTAIYEATSVPTGELTLTPTLGTAGTEITLATSAVSTMEDAGALDIKLTDSTGNATVCDDIITTKTSQGLVQATCKVPTLPADGDYTVSATHDKTGITYIATDKFAYTKPAQYAVHYNANDGTGVPADQIATVASYDVVPDYTFTLTEGTIPTRSGYTFGGWTTVATNQAGAYSPGSELYLTKDKPETTLYAIWIPNSEMGFGSLTGDSAKMQNMTSSICNNVSQGTTGRLQDTRDYKVYYVTKMKDDKCWMSQNLSLDISKDKTYTSADTNTTTDWKPGESSSIYKSTIPAGHLVNNTTWKNDYNLPYSYNPGDDYFTTSGTTADDSETTSGDAHYSAGNYYNWSAAVANNDTSSHTSQYDTLTTSICPKGWRLPKISSSSSTEWGSLLYAQGISTGTTSTTYATDGFNNIRIAPLYLVRSGYVYSSSRNYLGNYGYYWSSSVDHRFNAYDLGFGQNSPDPMRSDSRFSGFSVRCLVE